MLGCTNPLSVPQRNFSLSGLSAFASAGSLAQDALPTPSKSGLSPSQCHLALESLSALPAWVSCPPRALTLPLCYLHRSLWHPAPRLAESLVFSSIAKETWGDWAGSDSNPGSDIAQCRPGAPGDLRKQVLNETLHCNSKTKILKSKLPHSHPSIDRPGQSW